jgi:hypothetical protein
MEIRTPRERPLDPADLMLFEAELSDSRLERLEEGDLPKGLLELQVPLLAWVGEPDTAVFAQPLRSLSAQASYTLTASGFARLAVFGVVELLDVPRLERLWPPKSHPAGGTIVLCGASAGVTPRTLRLDPGAVPAEVEPGFGAHAGEPCALVRFDPNEHLGRTLVLPPELDGAVLDAEALELGVRDRPVTFPACTPPELELGPGCARVEDDRLIVRNADQPLLWRFEPSAPEALAILETPDAGGAFVLFGLVPGAVNAVRGTVIASDGVEAEFAADVTTEALRARVVLNEVLANPAGAEPASEWVELYNASSEGVELGGMRLQDSAGSVELPEAYLPSGAYAVLVREDFAAGAPDIAPPSGARLVRLPELAKNGLGNAGEPLALLDRDERVLSRFPAVSAARAGVSIARRAPDALDTDLEAFSRHAPPGASPGAENVVMLKD